MMKAQRIQPVLGRGFQAVHLLLNANFGLGVTELAKKLEIAPSSTQDILRTLMTLELVEQNEETKRYWLSPAIFELIHDAAEHYGATPKFFETLRRESQSTGYTYYFQTVFREVMYVTYCAGPHADSVALGANCAIGLSSTGKAILSRRPRETWASCYPAEESLIDVPGVVPDLKRWIGELETARETGIAWNRYVTYKDCCSLGAALHVEGALMERGIAMVIPRAQYPDVDQVKMEQHLLGVVDKVSRILESPL